MPRYTRAISFAILMTRLIQDPRGWRVQDLCETFEIQPRTWRAWRKELLVEGVPGLCDEHGAPLLEEVGQGQARRVRLRRASPRGPSDRLFRPWMIAALWLRQRLERLEDTEMDRVAEQLGEDLLEGVCPTERMLEAAERKVYLHPRAPRRYDDCEHDVRQALQTLARATMHSLRVRARYRSAYRARERARARQLEPLSLVYHQGAIYVLARPVDVPEVRIFELGRFEHVEVTRQRFDYPREFDPRDYFDGYFGIYQRPLAREVHVELVFVDEPWLKVHLRERQWHPDQCFTELEDGRLRLRFRTRSMDQVWPWIRSFGEDVEVCSPAGPVPRSYREQRRWRQRHEGEAA